MTATLPYPTHLTITTPSTSRINGDWGFKRPLPLKTTTKQTFPLVRVRQMDSTEHVTDFQSASDHTMTLKKFQELNLPISVPERDVQGGAPVGVHPRSVFEEDGDVTAMEPAQAESLESKRWKFKGPWLAGMTDGEFKRWLEKNVRAKRAEFHVYLKEVYAKELTEEYTSQAIQDQLPIPPEVKAADITESQFMDHLRDIRQDRLVLYRRVSRFLDLAPLCTDSQFLSTMKVNRPQEFDRESPYGIKGPPITHPSAGLSYLRTPHFIENHPIYGPQKYHPVVKARVLKPRSSNFGIHDPVIGVAGFVVDRPVYQKNLSSVIAATSRGKTLLNLDLVNRGGSKIYYKLDSATIDSGGRLRINISDPANAANELVVKELLGEDNVKNDLYREAIQGTSSEAPRNPNTIHRIHRKTHMYGSKESYGLDKA
ncbi:hypothetical protein GQX73_g2457 [Xylaria multiplex]|uniref:Uncharacterized protein n=1 Tax=Xylaria multiplex TaxID=323545 RepID=A0A7C8N1Z0_9PEZI|nr:hypothetical protein GQX73_g2457 [Xylaria multiplex]